MRNATFRAAIEINNFRRLSPSTQASHLVQNWVLEGVPMGLYRPGFPARCSSEPAELGLISVIRVSVGSHSTRSNDNQDVYSKYRKV